MIKKILSIFLASVSMFSSVTLANGTASDEEKKPQKSQLDSPQEKSSKNKIYLAQKAFLVGLSCALNINVKIKFDNNENYDFEILNIGCFPKLENMPLQKQSIYLILILNLLTKGKPVIKENAINNNYLRFKIDNLQIGNHIVTRNYIYEISELILNMIHERKLIAIKENRIRTPLNLLQDEEFANEIKDSFSDILKPLHDEFIQKHEYYLPPIC